MNALNDAITVIFLLMLVVGLLSVAVVRAGLAAMRKRNRPT